jgi:hypothetical protein
MSSLLGGSPISPTSETLVHIEYSTKPPGKLKKHVMRSLMNLMAPKGKLLVMIM